MMSGVLRASTARRACLVALVLVGAGVLGGEAHAASCTYDAATRSVTATIDAGGSATLVVSGTDLVFGGVPVTCGGATTTNTDSIAITGNVGTSETLTIDQRGGVFGPGLTPESNNPEIEIATALGDTADRVIVHGTEGADRTAAGQNGFATSADGDVDITFSPSMLQLEVHLHGGDDYFNGRGESGAGLHFLGPIVVTGGAGNESLLRGSSDPDSIDGGPGNDQLRGEAAIDVLTGGDGDDLLVGGAGDDSLTGGPGVDTFTGTDGNDTMYADDDLADASFNGGPGADTAYLDVLDPAPTATETVIRPAESCDYDGASRALTLTMTPQSQATLVVVGGAIWFGEVPVPCGAATTTNSDSIAIEGNVGTTEMLIIDQRGGTFAPGFTPESNNPEIEIATTLGDATDRVVIYGTTGADVMAAGQNGVATSSDGDVDITFAPNAFPLEVHLLEGNDHFDARGTGGAGLQYLGPVVVTGGDGNETLLRGGGAGDVIDGGPGADALEGMEGADILRGGPGDDNLAAGGGDDSVDGGAGADAFIGSDGNDTFYAQDDEADVLFSGGSGTDTAYVDTGLDPAPIAVENILGDGGPPPPTGTGCTYDAGTNAVTANIAATEQATLLVVGGAIHFGTTPVACGGATTANTDTIVVNGASGSIERLTVDLSGGMFAPGATAEASGVSEIEVSITLGDTSDIVVVSGTDGPDTISLGTTGIAYTTDGDADVTLSPLPALVEVFGLGGPNTLSGRGGSGTGASYPGRLVLHAGDSGDTLTGGSGADELYGGASGDVIEGQGGNDILVGGPGNDALAGHDGDDQLLGGAGSDSLIGGDGTDTLRGDDDEPDSNLNGGPGVDTAYYDAGIDPLPVATENRIPA